MRPQTPTTLNWPAVSKALRACTGEFVMSRDGRDVRPADAVKTRPAAKGTELCLFDGEAPVKREELVERLDALSKTAGRRFMGAARARAGDAFLLIDSVTDETLEDGAQAAVVNTRRPKLGFNASEAKAPQFVGRTKRIKTG